MYLPAEYGTLIFGFAAYISAATNGWSFFNSEGEQVSININADGKIVVRRGGVSGDIIAQSYVGAFTLSTWLYIEIKLVINASVGIVEIRINGDEDPVLLAENLNTLAQTTATINGMRFYQTQYFTDMYIDTAQFHGNVTIDTRYPDGVGSNSDMTSSTGGANYTCVDEMGAANTTDYVETGTVGDIDTYTFADINVDGHIIHAVNHYTAARQTDAGNVDYEPVTIISATAYNGDEDSTTTDIVLRNYIQETNPATAAAWTESEINAAEFGVELTGLV